jgi:hypothetical protein
MHAVQSDLAAEGIAKTDKNAHGNYYFRGIDAVQNALAPILSSHGLLIIPKVLESNHAQTQTSGGKTTNHWSVKVEYTFINASGEGNGDYVHKTEFVGEAYDTSDKGLNKALTASYKYMLFEVFHIPVEGSQDADSDNLQAEAAVMSYDQLTEIKGLLMQTNTEEAGFIGWLGIASIDSMPAHMFPKAKNALEQKRDKLARDYQTEQNATHQSMESENG